MAAPRFLHGDPARVNALFNTSLGTATYTFAAGDFLLQNGATVGLAGTTATVTNFIGLAGQAKPSGTTGTALRLTGNSTDGAIQVCTGGIWEVDRSDTIALNVGDPMALDGVTANTLAKVGDESISLARVAEAAAASSARVKVRIMSRVFPAALKS